MAINASRSMNESLDQGAIDGTYKQIRRDTAGQTSEHGGYDETLVANLHLAYYGIGEARMADVPAEGLRNMPFFVGNKFEIEEEGPTFGKTW